MRFRAAARRLLPPAVLFLLAVVLFAPATLGGKVLSASDMPVFEAPFGPQPATAVPANPLQYDAAYVFEPDGLLVRAALRAGRLPVWTPHQSAGAPLLASQQSAPLFPLTWLGVVFGFFSALAWIAVLKLTLAGLGTALLCRALGLRAAPAMLAAITFAFGTYLVVWLGHPHGNAYVLLPWMLLLAERLCRDGTRRDASLLGVTTGLAWLSGQPESALLVTLPTAAWVVHRLATSGLPRADRVRRGLLAAAAGIGGLLMAAVMLLPLFEALGQAAETSRAQPPLPLEVALTLVAPEWWGRPDGVQVLGPANFTERTLYAGALPTLLAVVGLVSRRPSGPQWFFLVLALVGVAVSWDTGPVATTVARLPVLDAINVTRTLVLTAFAVAILAGFGLQRLLDAEAARRRRLLALIAAGAVLPLLVTLAVHPAWTADLTGAVARVLGLDGSPDGDRLALASVVRWLGFGAVAVVAVAVAVRRGPVVAGVVACAIAAADLLAMGAGYNPAITRAQAQPPVTPALQAAQQLTAAGGRVVGFGALQPNTASRWGLHDARGHEQPTIERTDALYRLLGGWGYGQPPNAAFADTSTRVIDVFGVRAVILAPAARRAPEPAVPTALADRRVVHRGADGTVLQNETALPPAWVAYDWRPAGTLREALRSTVTRGPRELRDEPTIETDVVPPTGAAPAATEARVTARSDTSVEVEVDARRSGRLVLLDTFYPGWNATVDGRDVTIDAANGAFRSVPVGAGRHRVRFEYRPASVRTGALVSLGALVVLLVVGLTPRAGRPSRARHRPAGPRRGRFRRARPPQR